MQIIRANRYAAEPDAAQHAAMVQWVGACRHEYNYALDRRQYEYRNYGFSLGYKPQAKELTGRRGVIEWLDFAPVHALQYALQALDAAFQRFFKGLGGYPKRRKKFENDSFTLPADDIKGFKRLNKNHGAIKLPKIGWLHLRAYRPLGGKLPSVTFRLKAVAGMHPWPGNGQSPTHPSRNSRPSALTGVLPSSPRFLTGAGTGRSTPSARSATSWRGSNADLPEKPSSRPIG